MPLTLLLRGLWARRRGLGVAALLLWAAGASLVLAMPRAHVAQAVVAPAETTSFAVSSLLAPSPFAPGGLLDTRPTGNFAIYLGAMRSPEAAALIARETTLPTWLETRRAAGPGGWLREIAGGARRADADDVQEWLERNLGVTQSLASVTWTLELAHPDPALALDMLRRLHGFAEAKVRADLAEQAGRRVAALERRLARESDLFLRNSLYELLAQQQRAGLVVAADEAVAARLVSAPMVEARPSLPNRPLLLALLAIAVPVAVVALGAALVLLRHDAAAFDTALRAAAARDAVAMVAAVAGAPPGRAAGREEPQPPRRPPVLPSVPGE
jgi:hypothetical protein